MTSVQIGCYSIPPLIGSASKDAVAMMKIFEYFTHMIKRTKSALPEIMTVEEVAAYLKITERSIYGLLSKKKLPAFKVGGSWRFRRDEIENLTRKSEPSKKKGPKR